MMTTRSQLPSSPVSTPHEYPCPQQRPGVGLGERRRLRSTQTDQKEQRVEGELSSHRVGWTGAQRPVHPTRHPLSCLWSPPRGAHVRPRLRDPWGVSHTSLQQVVHVRTCCSSYSLPIHVGTQDRSLTSGWWSQFHSNRSLTNAFRFEYVRSLFRSCVCSCIYVRVVGRRLVADLGMCACSVVGVSS